MDMVMMMALLALAVLALGAYNSVIDRTDAGALIPEDVTREIIKNSVANSVIMPMASKLQNMARAQRRMPVLSSLPVAYFVNGDTGTKQTTNVEWVNKYIDAEELAVIVPIPESVLDDTDYDIWAEIRPLIEAAFGKAFDAAVIHGTNAPASWPDDLVTKATAASNTVSLAASADLYDAVLGESGVFAKVESDGYFVSGSLAHMTVKAKLRGLRDTNGQPIFMVNPQTPTQYLLDGTPVVFAENDSIDSTAALQIAGNWKKLVYAVRQDISYKILDQAVIQDGAGNIVYNLAQQDMVAMRAVFRLGWQVPNPVTQMQPTEASRYPFAILLP